MGKEADKARRCRDEFSDRRSGEDRRKVYDLLFFNSGEVDRRNHRERRSQDERRANCIRVSEWSSVCPDPEDSEGREGRIEL